MARAIISQRIFDVKQLKIVFKRIN